MRKLGSPPLTDRCFLCDRTSDQVVWRENGVVGRLCECGLLYADTGGKPLEVAEFTNQNHPESFYALPARLKAGWMAARCPQGKLLEIGCGEASFLKAARELGYEVSGMEPHTARAQAVEKQLGIEVERAFIEDDSLPAGTFDVVFHCDLLAHFPDPIGALGSMTRLLRPDGVLCFEVGILGGVSPFWYRLIGDIALGSHRFLYSFRALDELLRRAGLRVLHQTNFGLAPAVILHRPVGAFANRIVRPVLAAAGSGKSEAMASGFKHRLMYSARYRLGRIAPAIVGPATVLIVARKQNAE